ncbi:MAG: hypothetical protein ACT4P7_15895 [Gemmatimonadaceae bacterium]
MLRPHVRTLALALFVLSASGLAAQQKLPPLHALGAVERKSAELLGAVSATRALPDGRVLVNDIVGRRVLLFEPTLATYSVVADTTSATANAYSSRFGGLIAYRGDSRLFIDPTSLSMLVIDEAGKIARVMSIPRPNDAGSMIGGPNGTPAFDTKGRLVYRAPPQFRMQGPAAPRGNPDGGRPAGGPPAMPDFPDSVALVRVELATRKLDTVSFLRIPKTRMSVTQDSAGRMMMTNTIHPLPSTDDWALLADGSIALLRGLDYHIDWVRPDGSKGASGKIPFQWRHLSDSDKVAFIDSARTAMEKLRAQANAARAAGGGVGPVIAPPGAMAGAEVVGDRVTMVFREGAKREAAGADAPRPRDQTAAPANFTIPPLQFVAPNELPDYAPPFGTGAARADLDGNLWIRTTNVVNGGPVYDVVDVRGELIDRVLVPTGRVVAGFGRGGLVYMGVREGSGVRLEQARRTAVALP